MTIELNERNGHAAAAEMHIFLARLERRLAEVAESGEQRLEQRVVVLRDAIGDFVAEELEWRDEEIRNREQRVAELEHKAEATKSCEHAEINGQT